MCKKSMCKKNIAYIYLFFYDVNRGVTYLISSKHQNVQNIASIFTFTVLRYAPHKAEGGKRNTRNIENTIIL
jgi:hypothetical protein